jgi:hypothetical protein
LDASEKLKFGRLIFEDKPLQITFWDWGSSWGWSCHRHLLNF